MIRTLASFVALFALASMPGLLFAEPPALPEPPEGYEWQWREEIRSAFLQPAGWHFHEKKGEGTYACVISKEKIEGENGQFETGLTVNVISGVGAKTQGAASAYAKRFVAEATKDEKNILMNTPMADRGRLKTFVYRIKHDETVVHYVLIADDVADKLYMVLFESPEKEWDAAWKIGEPILKKLYFEMR